MFESLRQFFRENPRMRLVVALAVVLMGAMVWWVFGGFGFQFSQFFAAQLPAPGVLSVQCTSTQAILSWNIPAGSTTNAIQKNINGQGWQFINNDPAPYSQTTLTDTFTPTTVYRHKSDPNVVSNLVQCPPAGTPTPSATATPSPSPTATPTTTPSPTPSPTPTSAAVQCDPDSQNTGINESATLTASGGTGQFTWEASAGAVPGDEGNGNDIVSYSWSTEGTKTVTARSGTESASCTVFVAGVQPTPTPGSGGILVVTKQARNVTRGETTPSDAVDVETNEVVEFVVTLRANSPVTSMSVLDTVPFGMSYRQGSLTINSTRYPSINSIVAEGLTLHTFSAGETRTLRWSAVADRTGQLAGGQREVRSPVVVTLFGTSESADVAVTISDTGGGVVTGPGGVQTGPGDASLLALTIAATLTLLYTAYTRSPAFRRRDIRKLSKDQGPLDFRS